MRGALLVVGLAACAHAEAPAPVPPVVAATPVAPMPVAPATVVVPASFEEEYRQLLDEMVAVDTSHGNETALLEPIAARYRRAGVDVQILESAPGRGNLIARLPGGGQKRPLLLLAHVDVVPVEGQPWTVPPFAVTEKDGFLWGRGINDDKGMAAAIVAVTLELARAKTPLARDLIVALTAGEETGGAAGVQWLVAEHRELLDATIALNEGGGGRLSDDLTKIEELSFGVAEKIYQSYHLVVRGPGGHSSQPPTDSDPVTRLARAIERVGALRFAPRVLPEVKASFAVAVATAKPEYVAALRHVVASAPKVAAADERVLAKDRQYNAQMRTTCVVTMLQAAPQENVLPTTAEATVNCRILPGETRAQTQAALVKAIGDPLVELQPGLSSSDVSATPAEGEVLDAVKQVAATHWGDVPVIPAMSTGATDSVFLRGIGIHAYGVSPSATSRPEILSGHGAHGPDERRPAGWLLEGAHFFRDVVRTLAL